MKHYVMRTHSHTDLQMLWKVMSRPIRDRADAEFEAEWHASNESNKEHSFFVVSVEDDTMVHKT
jgi:hypothetical protein